MERVQIDWPGFPPITFFARGQFQHSCPRERQCRSSRSKDRRLSKAFREPELYTDAPYFGRDNRPAKQRHQGRDDQFIEW
jgi:hypothetical protein